MCASNTDICCAVDHCLRSARVAVVEAVFTTTAYSSFYSFYSKYAHTPMGVLIKKDLGLLNTTLREGWGFSSSLYSFVTSGLAKRAGLSVGNNTWIISDVDVNNGELFNSQGVRNFDVVILGFTEYVTLKEYLAYKHFVASGGHILVLSACNFLAEVSYNPLTKRVSLVEGHGWVFNVTAAWRGVYARWYTDNTDWVGSDYALYSARGYTISGAVANPPTQRLFENRVFNAPIQRLRPLRGEHYNQFERPRNRLLAALLLEAPRLGCGHIRA